jgi:tetratricopeptide (TPR) repeat protein
MKASLLATALGLAVAGQAAACLNISDVTLDGRRTTADEVHFASRENLLRTDDVQSWKKREEKLRLVMATREATQTESSDYGGVLAHLGQFEKARQVLEEAEKRNPGDYAVASNLGTVYELLGENEKARQWIAEGMKRNPASHRGTEWLHLKILDAKIALAADPKWLQTHSVLDVNYGNEARPVAPPPEAGPARLLALQHQLRERLQFVKPPDAIVGELLFALGNEVAVKGAVQIALGIYELAATYQPVQQELLRLRIDNARQVLAKAGIKTKPAKR